MSKTRRHHQVKRYSILRLLVLAMVYLGKRLPLRSLPKRQCLCLCLLIGLLLPNVSPSLDSLYRVYQQGKLKVYLDQPAHVHSHDVHPSNVAVEVLQLFVQELEVGLELEVLETQPEQVLRQEFDFIVVNNPSNELSEQLTFTQPILSVDHFLVHHKDDNPMQDADGFVSSLFDQSQVSRRYDYFFSEQAFNEHNDQSMVIFDLLSRVQKRKLTYTVALSHEYEAYKHVMPELVAMNLGHAYAMSWGFKRAQSPALHDKAQGFISALIDEGMMEEIQARFFWNDPHLNQLERKVFFRRVTSRLQVYLLHFQSAALSFDLDWRLLAAIAYQESHWDPEAVSPTGVRGMMMLTRDTAKEMGIKDRLDAEQSIFGGAGYYRKIKNRLPNFIAEPDRTWMALAAYNMGLANVRRAIRLTQVKGGNPTDWFDVREQLSAFDHTLPTVKKVRYIKGAEQAKRFVKRIRLYYDLLKRPHVLEDSKPLQPINVVYDFH